MTTRDKPASDSPAIVRVAELSMLRDLVDEPADSGRVLAVIGEPGAGKTHLISAVVRQRQEAGRQAIVLRCAGDAGEPVINTIHRLSRQTAQNETTQNDAVQNDAVQPRRGRLRARDLVVIEDAHLADARTISELELIAGGVTQPPADIVLALRRRQTPLELERAITLGVAFGRARRIELTALTDEQLVALGAQSGFGTPTHELRNRSGGNPFNLCALQALDHNARGGDDAPVSPFVFAVLHEVRDLTPDELRVLHAAAVLRSRFDLDLIAEVAQLDPQVVASAMSTLLHRDLLRTGGVGNVFAVRDDVVGALIHRTIDPYWADKAHQRAIRVLSGRGLADREIGFHLVNSLSGDRLDELDRLVDAAREVMNSDAAKSIAWLAPVAAEAPVGSAVGVRARVALSIALSLTGRLAESRELLFLVCDKTSDVDPVALADQIAVVSIAEGVLSQDEQTLPLLNAKVADPLLRELPVWPRLVLAHGFRLTMVGDTTNAQDIYEALALARRNRDDMSAAGLMAILALSSIAIGDLDSAFIHVTTAGEVLDRCPEQVLGCRLASVFLLGLADVYLGRYAAARRQMARGVSVATQLQQTFLLPSMLVLLSEAERHLGLLKDARNSAMRAAIDAGPDNTMRHSQAVAMQSLAEVWLQPAGSGRAKQLARQALSSQSPSRATVNGSASIAVLALAIMTWLDGDPQHCVTLLLNEGKGGELAGMPMAQRAKTWEQLCAAGLDAGLSVADWASRGRHLAKEIPLVHHQAYALLIRGHLARSAGDSGDAARCYLEAADLFLSVSMSIEQARALGHAAAALTDEGRTAEAKDAAQLAVELASRSEAATLVHWLERNITAPRRGQVPDAEAVDEPPVLDELTRREREVAQLICSGMKRKEIAERLRISTRTVDVHLTRIYRKTGVHSNTQLAVVLSSGRRGE
jgi:DNA-binding NarL/FixJ family response regulator